MILIDGKKAAAELRNELKKEVAELKSKYNNVPGLTVILIGDLTPSQIYVRNKEKSAVEVGLKSDVIKYPDTVDEKTVLEKITQAAMARDVARKARENVRRKGALELSGVGRSNLNGKPMTQLLLKENCTVTITHSKTTDLKAECLEADIIVAAVGIPELVKGDWVKKGAIVIDVGINKTDKGIVGDVDFDQVSKVASALTPVPGGVGPMTIACLLKNTVECFKRSQK